MNGGGYLFRVAGTDQQGLDRRQAGDVAEVLAVGDDEAVAGCGGELGDHTHDGEPDGVISALGRFEAQLHQVTGVQLVVVQGLLRQQDPVAGTGEPFQD
jgi:hypothetical protein